MQSICCRLKRTIGYLRAARASARCVRSRLRFARECVSLVFVAAPVRYRSNERTKSDQLPRESFDNQNPYAVNVQWYAMTMRRLYSNEENPPQAAALHDQVTGAGLTFIALRSIGKAPRV